MRLAGPVIVMVVGLLTAGAAALSILAYSFLTVSVPMEMWVVHVLAIVSGSMLFALGAGRYRRTARRWQDYEEPFE